MTRDPKEFSPGMKGDSIAIADIKIGERYRKDMGNLKRLADSMRKLGLLQPIVLSPDGVLVAGQRRLEAAKLLGWKRISTVTITTLDDAVKQLTAERDENTCREEFKPTEKAALVRALLELEKPKADTRRLGNLKQAPKAIAENKKPQVTPSVKFSHSENRGRAVTRATEAVTGNAGEARTVSKVMEVEDAATDQTKPEEVREVAKQALQDMDRSGSVDGAYKRFKNAEKQAEPDPVEKHLMHPFKPEDKQLILSFQDAIKAARRLATFDTERIAGAISDEHMAELDQTTAALITFTQRVHQHRQPRKGFTVVNGGTA